VNRLQRFGIDADEIAPGLWQGSAPPIGNAVARAGFDTLVLAAQEYQPSVDSFPGVRKLVRLPIGDEPITVAAWRAAVATAGDVTRSRQDGGRVLVTCQAGLNRSGLVSALSLIMLDGMTGRQVVARVRSRRTGSLFNPSFVAALHAARYPERDRAL